MRLLAGEKFPVLLEYLPCRNREYRIRNYPLYSYFVQRGYVAAAVDIRGTGNNYGLRRIALRHPPALKTIIAIDSTEDLYQEDVHFMDGVLHIDSWEMSQDLDNARPAAPDYRIDESYFRDRFDTEPWMLTYKRQQRDGPFWDRPSARGRYDDIRIPSFHIGGWYDGYRDSIPRFRALGVVANFQPVWAYADEYITELTIPFVGPERTNRMYPIGSLFRSGAMVAFGSDWPVTTPNPLEEIEVALTRMGPQGETTEPFVAAERISLPEALAAFTINAAYANRMETQTGSIETGKLADLIILDQNLFTIPPGDLSQARVLVTLFEGKAVHGDLDAL